MASESPLLLQVVQAPPDSTVVPGMSWAVHSPGAVVGRSPDADIVIPDRTVSRAHARVRVGPPVTIEALTTSNGTFVGDAAVHGGPVVVPAEGARVQLGGVLLALGPLGDTEPVLDRLGAARPGPPGEAPLTITWDAGQCVARWSGRDLGLTGGAARLLGVLAGRAGQVVHHWDLEQELGTLHVAPLVTAVRRALSEAIDAGVVDEVWLRERVRSATGEAPAERAALMRAAVQSRRGHGYVLYLRHDDVVVVQV